ncbi:MAG: YdcF family protein [Lachnospiraceae bacterium]|nr:YdcF family protein [Lachnospiraceae bacterium]
MRHALEMGCLCLGILCLFYYLGIALYAGITTSFAWVWLSGGAVLLLLQFALRFESVHPHIWLRFLTGAVFALLAAAFVIILVVGSRIVSTMCTVPQENLDYVIVLGAQVRGTSPSLSLKKRLDCAAEYAEENPDTTFILSGGQGSDEDISEAECMAQYLAAAGVSKDRLVMEDASTSTRENLIFSAEIIRALDADKDSLLSDPTADVGAAYAGDMDDGGADAGSDRTDSDRETEENSGIYAAETINVSVGILSNNFHIYRALLLARQIGYTNVSGIPADSVLVMQPHNILRETCAVLVMKCKNLLQKF